MKRDYRGLGWFFLAGILLATCLNGVLPGQSQVWKWSQTAGTNATADPNINWREGQAPSSINDSARAMMAQLAFYRDSISGVLADTGTSTAYAVSTGLSLAVTPTNGQLVCFTPANTNGAAVTFAADSGTAFPIQTAPGTAIPAGAMVAGTPYCVTFAANAWLAREFFAGSSFVVPLGAVLPYTAATAPNSSFALANGQAISRTTYAAYFSLVGTAYGSGDGTTTFNIADLRARGIAGQDNMGSAGTTGRISAAGGNFDATVLAATGGAQNQAIAKANIPNYNLTITDPGHSHASVGNFQGNALGGSGISVNSGVASTGNAVTGISVNSGGSGTALPTVLPIMVMPYIIRIQ